MGDARVLELRIHGIANAPPADTLCTTDEKVERKEGDEQGSFWQITPTGREGDGDGRRQPADQERLTPGTASSTKMTPATPPSAAMPPGATVTTEAYSWGNQARSGGSALALLWRAVVHLGWLLVLPFGLCNLAYWARRDIKGEKENRGWWAGGAGAGAVRVFALLQTLFYTVGLLTVSVYLIGLQCFRPNDDADGGAVGHFACAALPNWLDFLAGWNPTARAALLGILPVAVILLVYAIVLRARGNFHPDVSFDDERMPREQPRADPSDPPRPPLLASAGFWQRARIAKTSERTHVAAAFSLVLFLLAADALLDATGMEPLDVVTRPGEAASSATVPFWATVIGGVLLLGAFQMAFVTGLSGKLAGDRAKRRWATLLLALSALASVAWSVWAIAMRAETTGVGPLAGDRAVDGLVIVPTAIAALGALIAVGSLSWGYPVAYRLVSGLMLLAALACVAGSELWAKHLEENPEGTRFALSSLAAAFVLLAILVSYSPLLDRDERVRSRVAGWHGNGATVALLAAWFSSLVITSLLVLGAHAWLTADADAPAIDDNWRVIDSPTDAPILPPPFYERFGGMFVIVLLVLLLLAGVALIAGLHRYPAFSLPGLMYPSGMTAAELQDQRERDGYLGGARRLIDGPATTRPPDDPRAIPRDEYPTSEHKPFGRLRAVADARRVAALAHRGESMLRMLAILTASALLFLGIPFFGEVIDGSLAATIGDDAANTGYGFTSDWALILSSISNAISPVWNTLASLAGWMLGLLALAVVAWVVTNAVTSTERPLGLVWDIICFFPRAGHPFSPPCYAERAVPEVNKRITRFLREEAAAGNDAYVILSAHSMGATIAAAAIFAIHEEEQRPLPDAPEKPPPRLPRIALLTHGVQLRAYFSRFFPEVFGPRVLGVRGTMPPAIWRSDPWKTQVLEEHDRPRVPIGEPDDPATLVSLLGGDLHDPTAWVVPRWRSLWRRTDYLGFPVFGYWSNVVDGANENPIDRGATERAPRAYLWTIARHNDYLSTLQYREARDELVDMLTAARAGAP